MFDTQKKVSDSSGKLLSEPDGGSGIRITRETAEHDDLSQRFILKDKVFNRQYAHVYSARLAELRPVLEQQVEKKFGTDLPVRKLFELKNAEDCILIGTLFKHMEIKPNILKEISDEHNLVVVPSSGRYTQDEDILILEDELQRITLKGKIDVHSMATGVLIAVRGQEPEDDRGKFHVSDHCFLGLSEQVPPPKMDTDKYIAVVSGFELGSGTEDGLAQQLLVDWLTGQLGDVGQQEDAARIVRVIIAGNSLSKSTQDKEAINKAKYLTKNTAAGSVEGVKALDDILVQLAACVDVDIMPGDFDPANHNLPQQPMHRCMFPQASMYPTMHSRTNPYISNIEGLQVLGTSGQPITDIWKFSRLDDRLEILANTLEWGHIAPTAPDTLGCYPYTQNDPFIMKECPHIYFAGNQPEFSSKLYKSEDGKCVRLVCVPKFKDSRSVVLVNLRTLDCHPVCFNTEIDMDSDQESPVDK